MMRETLKKFCLYTDASVMDALKQIDLNAKGFVVVVDEAEKVAGVLTDGDIRRALINGVPVTGPVGSISRKNFKFLTAAESMTEATDLFKSSAIKFIPILDSEGRLFNILTKLQMHSLLLLDIHADFSYDFTGFDENKVDHEIFQRPWGFFKTTVMNDYFQSKIISVHPGGQLSLQSHRRREEYWIVAHGVGKVQLDDTVLDIRCGSSVFIPKGCRHRLVNTDDKESLVITEVQIGDYFGEDDIIRYEDAYGRR